jgi:hypothetical protein
MPSFIYTTEEILEAVRKHGSQVDAAKALGMKPGTLNKRLERARKRDEDSYPIVPGKSILYDAETGDPKLVWSTGKGLQGISPEQMASVIREGLEGYKPPTMPGPALRSSKSGDKNLLGLVPLVDLHMGLKIWGKECGEDWDIDIAESELLRAYRETLSLTPRVKKAYVIGKGDLLHADNYQYQTGTPGTTHVLDCDSRYPKMLWSGIDIVISVTAMTLSVADEVEIRILPGNHDTQSSVAIAIAVAKYFHKSKNVKVDLDPGPHWCAQWGTTMLAGSHGDKLKPAQMAEAFAAMHPKAWGDTRFRYFFSGHEHRERVLQRPGATVETLAAPVPIDSYAHSHGYLSSRHVQTMVFHKEKGRILTQTEPIL